MSFDYNKWESELRSKVETHEFAFDESAWEALDTLLDQGGGTIAPKENTPPASAGRFTSWIVGGLIVVATGLLLSWWMLRSTDENAITLSSFKVTTSPEEVPSENQVTFENAPSIKKAGSSPNPITTMLPADLPQQVTQVTTEEPTTFDTPTPIATPPKPEALADRSAAYLTPILDSSKAISPLPTALDNPFPETLPLTLKRRRNRRTLYPDVIERY